SRSGDSFDPIRPSLVARPAFFAALASPRFRRIVVASSKLPFASSRAPLQSIIPAPVWSRSFFTSVALIAMLPSLSCRTEKRRPQEGRRNVSRDEQQLRPASDVHLTLLR